MCPDFMPVSLASKNLLELWYTAWDVVTYFHTESRLIICIYFPFQRESFALYALYSKNKPQSDSLLINHGQAFFKVRSQMWTFSPGCHRYVVAIQDAIKKRCCFRNKNISLYTSEPLQCYFFFCILFIFCIYFLVFLLNCPVDASF